MQEARETTADYTDMIYAATRFSRTCKGKDEITTVKLLAEIEGESAETLQ